MELWDIYDVNKQRTGRTMKRNDWTMKPGDYHLTVLGVVRHTDQKTRRQIPDYPACHDQGMGTGMVGSVRRRSTGRRRVL